MVEIPTPPAKMVGNLLIPNPINATNSGDLLNPNPFVHVTNGRDLVNPNPFNITNDGDLLNPNPFTLRTVGIWIY